MHSTDVPKKTAVLAAVQLSNVTNREHADDIAELGDARTYLPATVYRMARCEPGDVDAIETMLTLFFGEEAELTYYDTLGSDSLLYNVALSEIWPEDPPPIASILAEQAKLYVSTGLTPEMAVARWGHYPDDAYVGAWAVTDTPLLMLNGDLDPQTPLALSLIHI